MIDFKVIPKQSAIYKIVNTVNDKFYIGSAVNLQVRIKRHFYELKINSHCNNHLQRSYIKYGIDCFKLDILEVFDIIEYEKLLKLEEAYILKTKAVELGYNQLVSYSDHLKKLNKTEEHVKKVSKKLSKKVMAFNRFTGEFVNTFDSVSETSIFFKTSSSNISRCCQGKFNYIKNCVFCYEIDYDSEKKYIFANHHNKGKPQSLSHRLNNKIAIQKRFGKDVYKYNKNEVLVAKYPSRSEAEKQNKLKKESLRCRVDKSILYEGFYWYSNEIKK